MPIDAYPLPFVLAPLLFVIGLIYILGPALPIGRPWARWTIFAGVWSVVLRYLHWRLFETVLPADGGAVEVGWVWFCFAIEILALGDACILYLGFLRTTDRREEADRHEARLRAAPAASLPSVDIFIPTYNEPFEVVEKTIVGALAIDYPNARVWVLDDGRRAWLKAFCDAKGAGYITRDNNAHAKAGNINHALTLTDAEYVAVFDADFIPQRNFLMRTLGFFEDPSVGIVQVPHAFYNHDPLQANLALRKTLPDDQRFFFEAIMPSRDGWDAAFCCGSNSITRRAAIRSVGDALPTGSITEDMLLSMALLRQGFVTRYLCERLAFGLAPESIKAFFVQRQRWARGALQILYLPEGPFGRGLRLMHRILFMPTHWLSQSLMSIMSVVTPLVFLWTGLAPLVNVTVESVMHYLIPMVLAIVGGITVYARRQYFPLAAQVLGMFQSFKILPTVLQTLVRPRGHLFKVTPKGGDAAAAGYERGIFWTSFALMAATLGGMLVNALPDWRIVEQAALVPLVAFWSGLNITVLFLVCMMCLQARIRRAEERFSIDEPAWLRDGDGRLMVGRVRDLSLSGVGIDLEADAPDDWRRGQRVRTFLKGVGFVEGDIARRGERFLGIQFDLPQVVERDLLIRKIFTSGNDTTAVSVSAWQATIGMLRRIWEAQQQLAQQPQEAAAAPAPAEEKLPAASMAIPPRSQPAPLDALAIERENLAA